MAVGASESGRRITAIMRRTATTRRQTECNLIGYKWVGCRWAEGGASGRQPNMSWQMITEATTPTKSAMRPAATAWRARRTATEPK